MRGSATLWCFDVISDVPVFKGQHFGHFAQCDVYKCRPTYFALLGGSNNVMNSNKLECDSEITDSSQITKELYSFMVVFCLEKP